MFGFMWRWIRPLLLTVLSLWLCFQTVLVLPRQLDDQSNVEVYSRQRGSDSYDQLARGIHLVEVKGAEREWELWADQADKRSGFQDWDLVKVKAQFFGRDRLRYNVLGRQGSVAESQKDMEIVGDVRTISSEGYRIEAESLKYNSEDRTLETPGHVSLFGPPGASRSGSSFQMEGVGLKAFVEESTIVLEDQVVATVEEPGQPAVHISSQKVTLLGESKTVVFEGRVRITYQEMVLRAPRSTFYFERAGASGLSKAVLDRGVRMQDSLRQGSSQKLTIYPAEERAEMEGNPRVVQGEDVLQGDKIAFLQGGERVQVLRARGRVQNLDEVENE